MRTVLMEQKPGAFSFLLSKVASHVPPGQFARYLVIGAWNTIFGYILYAAFTALLSPVIPHGYIPAYLLASLVSITVAFFGYKWFVFRTKGNYLKEWARCVMVYSGAVFLSLILLPVVVELVHRVTGNARSAPYIAGALMSGFGILYSFFGHKKFSFRAR